MGTTNPDNPDNASTSRDPDGVRKHEGDPSLKEQYDRSSRGQGKFEDK